MKGRIITNSTRWFSVFFLLILACPVLAGVVSVSPEGEIRDVSQVAIRFDTDMAPLGAADHPAPANIRCQQENRFQGRWLDSRRWVADSYSRLRPGTRCEISLKADLRDLFGRPVEKAGPWGFSTGGPRVDQTYPYSHPGYIGVIDENNVILIKPNASVDHATLAQVTCRIGDESPQPVEWLPQDHELVRKAVSKMWHEGERRVAKAFSEGWLAVRCGTEALPNDTKIVLNWGKGVSTPWGVSSEHNQILEYRVKNFRVDFQCQKIPDGGCDPRAGVTARFSTEVNESVAKLFELRRPDGQLLKLKDFGGRHQFKSAKWEFSGLMPEGGELTISLRGEVRDEDNHLLANAGSFPQHLSFGFLPPYLGMPIRRETNLAWRADKPVLLPLVARKLEPVLAIQDILVDGNDADWAMNARRLWLASAQNSSPNDLGSVGKVSTIEVKTKSTDIEFIGIPLSKPGLHLVVAESPAWDAFAAPQKTLNTRPKTLVTVTNLGLTVLGSQDGATLAWVTTIDSGLPVSGAEVVIFDCAGKMVGQGATDQDGLARLADVRKSQVAYCSKYDEISLLVVRHGNDLAIQTAPWDWPGPKPQLIGHTILDRTLFRPGETISMQHLLRQATNTGFAMLEKTEGKLVIHYQHYEKVAEIPLSWDDQGSATLQWNIPENAKLGDYWLKIEIPNQGKYSLVFPYIGFKVAEFRTPALDVKLSGAPRWQGKRQILPFELSGHYLSGGPAAELPVTLKGRYNAYRNNLIPGFSFYDESLAQFQDAEMPQIKLKFDQRGLKQYRFVLPEMDRPARLFAEMEFADASGEIQTVHKEFPIWPRDIKPGIKVEAPGEGKPIEVQMAVLDDHNQPLANYPVRLTVQAGKRQGYSYAFIGSSAKETKCEGRTDRQGHARCQFDLSNPPDEDYWAFRVETKDRLGRQAISSQLISKWQLKYTSSQNPSDKALVLDATAFRPGQTANVTVTPPFFPATLLLTASREGVLAAQVHRITQPSQKLALPITEAFSPHFSLSARFIRGSKDLSSENKETQTPPQGNYYALTQPKPENALLFEANRNLHVDTSNYRLDISLLPRQNLLRPGSKVLVDLAVTHRQDKRPATGTKITVVAVDEALLALLPNPSWNFFTSITRWRGVGISNRDSRKSLLQNPYFGPSPEYRPWDEWERQRVAPAPPVIGGAKMSSLEVEGGNTRTDFRSLAFWSTDLVLDANGKATVEIPFPDNLTRWRIVAFATQGADRFGETSVNVTTATDVQVFSGLPAIVRSGDRLIQSATLRNTGKRSVKLAFSARAKPEISSAKLSPQALKTSGLTFDKSLVVAADASVTVNWPVSIPQANTLTWNLLVTGPAGAGDALTIQQSVLPAVPITVRQATLEQIKNTQEIPLQAPSNALPGSSSIEVRLESSLTQAGLSQVAPWMERYPHTCLEQLLSRSIATDNHAEWQALMKRLPTYLDAQGLARYFPSPQLSGSEVLTAYILEVSAQSGWEIPARSREKMLDALAAALKNQSSSQDWLPDDARLWHGLALQSALSHYRPLDKLLRPDDPGALSATSLVDWGQALLKRPPSADRTTDLKEVARQLRSRYEAHGSRLTWRDENSELLPWRMGNGDTAAARATLWAMAWRAEDESWAAEIPLLARGLLGRQRQGVWYTTTANAWGSLALRAFAEKYERGAVKGKTSLALGQNIKVYPWNDGSSSSPSFRLPAEKAQSMLKIEHQGTGAPWASIALKAAVRSEQPNFSGIQVKKTITSIQQRSKGQYSVGDIYLVSLEMESDSQLIWVALHDPVPSGNSILGRGTLRESTLAGSHYQSHFLSYEELATDSYRAYFQRTPRGKWYAEYLVRINNAGHFSLPPTRVEAMYAPDIFGETPNPTVLVRP